MSFGASLAGFANGLNGGLTVGSRLSDMINEKKIADVREQGIAEAKAMQAKAMPQITDNGDMQNLTANPQQSMDPRAAQQPQPGMAALGLLQQNQAAGIPQAAPAQQPMADLSGVLQASQAPTQQPFESASPMASGVQLGAPKRFDVKGKQFDEKKEADAYAKSQAPAIEEFYSTTLVPRMKEALIGQGKVKEAEAWQTYADDDKSKRAMQVWGQAFQFAQIGDYNESAKRLMKLYPDYEDGFELVSAEPTKGEDGQDGFTMKVKDADGNEQTAFHTSQSIVEMGLQQLSPIEMFNKTYSLRAKKEEMKAREAIDARNDKRTADRMLGAVSVREQGQSNRLETKIEADEKKLDRTETGKDNRLSRTETGKDNRLERAAVLRAENDAKKVKDVGGFRKDASPSEQRRIVWQTLSKDPLFTTAEPAEQEDRINSALKFIGGGNAPAATATGGTVANPFSGGAGTVPKGKKPLIRNGELVWIDK